MLQDNKELENVLSEFQMPKMQYGTLRVAGFGETVQFEKIFRIIKDITYFVVYFCHVKPALFLSPTDLWYQMMLPPNFKKSKKYPLLIDV